MPPIKHSNTATALIDAANRGDLDSVRQQLDERPELIDHRVGDFTALTRAALRGHVDVVNFLLDRGAQHYVRVSFHTFECGPKGYVAIRTIHSMSFVTLSCIGCLSSFVSCCGGWK